jgi:hypothetical protein
MEVQARMEEKRRQAAALQGVDNLPSKAHV